jgi:hypothetical protein
VKSVGEERLAREVRVWQRYTAAVERAVSAPEWEVE